MLQQGEVRQQRLVALSLEQVLLLDLLSTMPYELLLLGLIALSEKLVLPFLFLPTTGLQLELQLDLVP